MSAKEISTQQLLQESHDGISELYHRTRYSITEDPLSMIHPSQLARAKAFLKREVRLSSAANLDVSMSEWLPSDEDIEKWQKQQKLTVQYIQKQSDKLCAHPYPPWLNKLIDETKKK